MLTHSLSEGAYDRTEQEIRHDEQEIENIPENLGNAAEQGFDNAVQDVEDIPNDIGNIIEKAANWIGDKVGSIEGEGRKVENEVSEFGQNVENSYEQGEQEGRNDN